VSKVTLEKKEKDTFRYHEELVFAPLERYVHPHELENELVQYCIGTDQRHYGLRQ
jgi:hypothetical protein